MGVNVPINMWMTVTRPSDGWTRSGNSELWHQTVFGWLAEYLKK